MLIIALASGSISDMSVISIFFSSGNRLASAGDESRTRKLYTGATTFPSLIIYLEDFSSGSPSKSYMNFH